MMYSILHRTSAGPSGSDQTTLAAAAFAPEVRQRWCDLLGARYEVLLYDLTSTYFECDVPTEEDDPRRFGYSRDKRGDCVQVVVALVVTPEGLPFANEMMPGNTADKTILRVMLATIRRRFGAAERIWIMDRGIPTEEILPLLRAADSGVRYLVGTPRPASPATKRRSPSGRGRRCVRMCASNSTRRTANSPCAPRARPAPAKNAGCTAVGSRPTGSAAANSSSSARPATRCSRNSAPRRNKPAVARPAWCKSRSPPTVPSRIGWIVTNCAPCAGAKAAIHCAPSSASPMGS